MRNFLLRKGKENFSLFSLHVTGIILNFASWWHPRRSHRRHPFYDKARVLDFISENPTVEESFIYTISII